MRINTITSETKDGRVFVSSRIEGNNINEIIFFSVPEEYGQYLVDEVDDAFIYALLLPALVEGEDIVCTNVSESVRYHFDTISYLLGKVFGYSPIKLKAENVLNPQFQPQAIATGFSGGVDSFATFIHHTSDDCSDLYRLTQLTLFNVGSYGNDYAKTSVTFSKDLCRAKSFANDVRLPLVDLDSNMSSIYTHKDIYAFSLRLIICLSAGILALGKLFKTYLIPSSGTIEKTIFSRWDQGFYENILAPLLSTATTQICIGETDLNRVEKTRTFITNPIAEKYLYVCAADIYNDKQGTNYVKADFPNCGECPKCVRTLLALDFLGILDKYADRFDLNKYRQHRDEYIFEVFRDYREDRFKNELRDLMLSAGYEPTATMRQRLSKLEAKRKINRIKDLVKRIIRRNF